MRFIIDTNVLVSALLNPSSTSAQVLECILSNIDCKVLLSPTLIKEYETVLTRPKFSKIIQLRDLVEFLERFARESAFIVPFTKFKDCKDADDNMIFELAIDGKADGIISGDKHVLSLHPFQGKPVLNPKDFLHWFALMTS